MIWKMINWMPSWVKARASKTRLYFIILLVFVLMVGLSPQTTKSSKGQGCTFNNIDPLDPATMKHAGNHSPLDCSGGLPSLVYVDGKQLRVNKTKMRQTIGTVDYCRYTPLLLSEKHGDSKLKKFTWSQKFLRDPIKLLSGDEHILAECYKNNTIVGETFKSRVTVKPEVEKRSAENYNRHITDAKPTETMSVLILGIDGMSKQNFIRTMPKTKDYIINHMNARELNKFNKIGDNTFPNILALQTGHSQAEIEKVFSYKHYFDEIEDKFLWHHYQKSGYRTAMGFDVTWMTAFHYLKQGWKHPTFDYYNRPLRLQIENEDRYRKAGSQCVGEVPELTVLQDYVLQIASTFNNTKSRPYFLYNFYTRLTHDSQDYAMKGDDIWFNYFKQLNQRKVLNNTIVMFFSDHGTRYGDFRHTFNGKIELNTPYVFFMFPPWFEKKYSDVMHTFTTNQNRLTTFYDIHKTFMDLLNFTGKSQKGSLESRGINLFDDIPMERSCDDAEIPMEYCNCKLLSKEKVPDLVSKDLTEQMLGYIVNITKDLRDKCALLKLKSVQSILVIKKNDDKGVKIDYYQAAIETSPGGALYEALLKYDEVTRKASLIGYIQRMNLYKGQDACVDKLIHKPYCYCMDTS